VADSGSAGLTRKPLKSYLERDEWEWQASSCAIEKEPHAQSFGALHSHQAHLPPDMVAILEQGDLRLVVSRIFLEPRNPLFNGLAKSGTDFIAFIGDTVGDHGKILGVGVSEAELFLKIASSFSNLCRC